MILLTMTCLVSIMKKAVVRGRMAGVDNNILCSLFNKVFLAHCANTHGTQREHNSMPTYSMLTTCLPND